MSPPPVVISNRSPTTYGHSTIHKGSDDPFQILSLDGGGFRGLFTATVLAKWEEVLGHSIARHFDMITGTSAGGIIGLGLAAGLPASALVKFYQEDGARIFPAKRSLSGSCQGVLHYFRRKYGADRIEESLRRRLPAMTLGDLEKPVVITGFNLEAGRHWYFKTPHFEENVIDRNRQLWEVARATSAAPTYFPAFRTSEKELFIDGGLVANNPSLVGYFEVALKFAQCRDNIKILNIGTEGCECSLPGDRLANGGLFRWAKKAPEVLMQAQAVSIEALMGTLLGPDRWMRVKPEHGRNFAALDVYDPEVYSGIGVTQAVRSFADVQRLFLKHQARTGLVQSDAK
jgi:uncharacterized protein